MWLLSRGVGAGGRKSTQGGKRSCSAQARSVDTGTGVGIPAQYPAAWTSDLSFRILLRPAGTLGRLTGSVLKETADREAPAQFLDTVKSMHI